MQASSSPLRAGRRSGLRDLLNILRSGSRIIAICLALGALAGLSAALMNERIFRARSLIEFQLPANYLPIPTGFGIEAEDPMIEAQLGVLRSKPLLDRTVKTLLARKEPAQNSGLARVLRFEPDEARKDRLIQQAAATLKATLLADTRIVEVYCESPDSGIAALVNSALTEQFIEQTFEQRRQVTKRTGESLTEQLEKLRKNLEKSEQEVQTYAKAHKLFFNEARELADATKLRLLEGEVGRARAEVQAKDAARKKVSSDSRADVLQSAASASVLDSGQELAELRLELARLSESYEPQHFRVQEVRRRMRHAEAVISAEYERILRLASAEHEAAAVSEKHLQGLVEVQKRTLDDRLAKMAKYDELRRTVDSDRALYTNMLKRVKDSSFGLEPQASTVRTVDSVRTAPAPGQHGRAISTVRGLLGGFVVGIVLAILGYRRDRTIKTPEEMVGPISELGIIPRLSDPGSGPSRSRFRFPFPTAAKIALRQAAAQWAAKEAFRSALVSLLYKARHGRTIRTVAVSSPGTREGKTFVTANLACGAAQLGLRVLVIDANLRHPQLHELFPSENTWGLSELLRNEAPMGKRPGEALVEQAGFPGLYLLSAGSVTDEDAALLYSDRLRHIIAWLRTQFDLVLVDTPATLAFSDTRAVARCCDGVVLAVRAGCTTGESLLAAEQILTEDGTAILGTIFNDWASDSATRHSGSYVAGADVAVI